VKLETPSPHSIHFHSASVSLSKKRTHNSFLGTLFIFIQIFGTLSLHSIHSHSASVSHSKKNSELLLETLFILIQIFRTLSLQSIHSHSASVPEPVEWALSEIFPYHNGLFSE
jgi:hypothetical protein